MSLSMVMPFAVAMRMSGTATVKPLAVFMWMSGNPSYWFWLRELGVAMDGPARSCVGDGVSVREMVKGGSRRRVRTRRARSKVNKA